MNTEGTNLVPFKIFAVDQLLGASQEAVAARKQAAVAGSRGHSPNWDKELRWSGANAK